MLCERPALCSAFERNKYQKHSSKRKNQPLVAENLNRSNQLLYVNLKKSVAEATDFINYKEKRMKKIIISADKNFDNYIHLKMYMDLNMTNINPEYITEIITEKETKAGHMAREYAHEQLFPETSFELNRAAYGSRAELIRNEEMVDYADALIIFTNKTNEPHLLTLAKRKNKEYHVVNY